MALDGGRRASAVCAPWASLSHTRGDAEHPGRPRRPPRLRSRAASSTGGSTGTEGGRAASRVRVGGGGRERTANGARLWGGDEEALKLDEGDRRTVLSVLKTTESHTSNGELYDM